MKRFVEFGTLFVLIGAALACNLGASPPATPTAAPPPILLSPALALSPVSGVPGTVINVAAAGYTPGAHVNLYLVPYTPNNALSPTALTTLTIGTGGILSFALQLPDKIGNTPIAGNTALQFTLTADNGATASALFLTLSGTSGAVALASATPASGSTGGVTQNLFITAPPDNSLLSGNAVLVTGSGSAANGVVGVQVLDAVGNVLGSANASIQAARGAVGVWQVTVSFNQPAGQTGGSIYAFTAEGKDAGIPITLAGSGGVVIATPVPLAQPTAGSNGGFAPVVTATKLFSQ